MGKVTIYLPDDLAAAARAEGLSVSAAAQDALRERLSAARLQRWLASLPGPPAAGPVPHAEVMAAIDAARDEFGSG